MDKKILAGIVLIAGLIIGALVLTGKPQTNTPNPGDQGNAKNENQNPAVQLNPLNAKYIVEGQIVSLVDGKEEKQIGANGEKQITEVSGTPVSGELNGDDQPDYALIITQKTTGDVGIYYYVAIALTDQKNGIIAGANAVPLGDRIEVKDIAIVNGAVKVNYLDRQYSGDATESSKMLSVTKTFALDGAMFKELLPKQADARAEAVCTDNGGIWSKENSECKGISKNFCDEYKGQFNDCAAGAAQCKPTCKF